MAEHPALGKHVLRHPLRCAQERLEIQLQILYRMERTLPKTLDYLTASFTRDAQKDLEKAEWETGGGR